jgi:hypothetical protein
MSEGHCLHVLRGSIINQKFPPKDQVVLIAPEEIVEPTAHVGKLPFTTAVVKEDETWGLVGTIMAMTIQYCVRSPRASCQSEQNNKSTVTPVDRVVTSVTDDT